MAAHNARHFSFQYSCFSFSYGCVGVISFQFWSWNALLGSKLGELLRM